MATAPLTAEKHAMAHEIEQRDAWVFESSTYATRAARANTLIWLDVPMILRLAVASDTEVVTKLRANPA